MLFFDAAFSIDVAIEPRKSIATFSADERTVLTTPFANSLVVSRTELIVFLASVLIDSAPLATLDAADDCDDEDDEDDEEDGEEEDEEDGEG